MKKLQVRFNSLQDVLDFINKVSKYPYDMDMKRGKFTIDAKSLLGVIGMGTGSVMNLEIHEENCDNLLSDIRSYCIA